MDEVDSKKTGGINGSLLFAVFVAAIGGFLFGYDTAVINGANSFLQSYFAISDNSLLVGLATASAVIGCLPGALVAGFLSDRFGRKRILLLSAVLFTLSAIGSAFPINFGFFLGARFIGGFGIGVASMVCPIYIAEVSPDKYRGRLGALFQFGIVFGILISLFVNKLIQSSGDEAWNLSRGWRWMLGIETLPALTFFILLLFIKESPRWLAGHLSSDHGRMRDLLSSKYARPLIIAVVIMLASQLSGINAIMYYSTEIFRKATGNSEIAFTCSLVIGFVNFSITLVAISLVDKVGRKPLLIVGNSIQVIALTVVGVLFSLGYDKTHPIVLLVFILIFIAAFGVAMGPIPWILCAEVFPSVVRAKGNSIATFSIWMGAYFVTQTFPLLTKLLGSNGTFWFYATCSFLTLLFVIFIVPETKGIDIEKQK